MKIKKTINNGDIIWRKTLGGVHRKNGPAVITDSGVAYYLNNNLHREDGPAVIYNNGMKEWYLDDKRYTEKEWKEKIRRIKLKELNF